MEREPRSSSLDPFDPHKLLDGISLSPEPISVMQFSHAAVPSLPVQKPDAQYDTRQRIPEDEFKDKLRLGPGSGDIVPYRGMSQWQAQAPPPGNILGITMSDDEEPFNTSLVRHTKGLPQSTNERDEHPGISHSFSPNTVARRKSLFDDIPGSSGGGNQ
jgi:hypothetical protein